MNEREIDLWERCVVATLPSASMNRYGDDVEAVAVAAARTADEIVELRRQRIEGEDRASFGVRYGKMIEVYDSEKEALEAAMSRGLVRADLYRCVEFDDDIFTSEPRTFERQADNDLWYQVASRDKLALAIAESLVEQVEQGVITEQEIGPHLAAQVSQYRDMHTIEPAPEDPT